MIALSQKKQVKTRPAREWYSFRAEWHITRIPPNGSFAWEWNVSRAKRFSIPIALPSKFAFRFFPPEAAESHPSFSFQDAPTSSNARPTMKVSPRICSQLLALMLAFLFHLPSMSLAGTFSVSQVPTQVFCSKEGDVRIDLRQIRSTPLELLASIVPEYIPVVYEDNASRTHSSLSASYAPPKWKLGKALKYPGHVVLSADGTWQVRFVLTTPRESDERSGRTIAGSERARVGIVSSDDTERLLPVHSRLRDRTGGPIFFNYFHNGAPNYLQQNETAIRAAIQRACDEWNDLLQDNIFELTVAVYWDDQLPSSTNAQTDPSSREPRNWTGLRSTLITKALDNFDVNADELDLYGALPLFSMPYRWGSSSSTTTTGITLSLPQLEVLYGYSTGNPTQIAFNPEESKRFTTLSRRFPVLEDQRDFQAIVTHEIGHALGFKSDAEEAQSFLGHD